MSHVLSGFFVQIPDAEEPMTDNNLGESSNSLPTLDGVEKQSGTQNSSLGQVTEMMVF
jgi:serine/threonine-protein kinase OSR1/STK39